MDILNLPIQYVTTTRYWYALQGFLVSKEILISTGFPLPQILFAWLKQMTLHSLR